MIVLAIDPGSAASGYVLYSAVDQLVLDRGKLENERLLAHIYEDDWGGATDLAIEMAQSFGAKVWDQVFVTTMWVGRFVEAWSAGRGLPHRLVYRRDVKLHVTGSPRAKDPQVRACLLERWGGKEKAVGTKAQPGPLWGVKADSWAALAIAVTFAEART